MSNPPSIDIERLAREDRVHRDVYIDDAVFKLEMKRIFYRAWLFVGHESQVPDDGCYISTLLADQPVIMVRHNDAIRVLFNRCPHRGARVCEANSGKAKPMRCPYHGWVFDTDGRFINSALHEGYRNNGKDSADLNMVNVPRVVNHRGFVFASLDENGPAFEQALGSMLPAIDNLVDRSPTGELELVPGIHRHICPGNWKLQLENIQDAAHPPFIHAASNEAGTKGRLDEFSMRAEDVMYGNRNAGDSLKESGLGVFPYGHSYLSSIPIRLKVTPEAERVYLESLERRHGRKQAASILAESRHFSIIYPQIMLQSHFRTMKVLRPVSVDKTEISVYVFRLKGAPNDYDHVAVQFANATNSPASIILQDDLVTFANIQQGLLASAGDWVLFANGRNEKTDAMGPATGKGFTELPMRNQYAAWRHYMSLDTGSGK